MPSRRELTSRAGHRTLVATNKGNRWVFVFGFPKNERSNIDKDEEAALKKLVARLLSLTAQALSQARQAGSAIKLVHLVQRRGLEVVA